MARKPKVTTVVPDKKGRRRLNKVLEAAVNHAFIGAAHPEEHGRIQGALTRARKEMEKHLDEQALNYFDLFERMSSLADTLEKEAGYGKGSSRETAEARKFANLMAAAKIRAVLKGE